METMLFEELVQSLKEAQAIAKGELEPSRRFDRQPLDVKAMREGVGLSQREFARLLHVSVRTLQNWEQDRRYPTGPALALLKIVATAPELAIRSLHS
ncbi:MAG: helix-turn-helix domain-containing protein [Candidatus Competibacteraceae bacterium]|nr:helix-turn-helix domain-containing protein [Candidatus Competibacteraceae bacterium]